MKNPDKRAPKHEPLNLPEDFTPTVCSRLEQNKRVRRRLPHWGRLHVDRQLPFLCVYRRPTQRQDAGTDRLLLGEAAYLLASGKPSFQSELSNLVREIAATLTRKFGSFLIIEIWSARDDDCGFAEDPDQLRPSFKILAPQTSGLTSALERLNSALRRIKVHKKSATVEVVEGQRAFPPGMRPLLSKALATELDAKLLGMEIKPVYRDATGSQVHPLILRAVHRGLSRAIKQGVFEFARSQTVHTPAHYHALGRRAMVKAVWEVDRQLAQVCDSFDLLLDVTPVNLGSAWAQFKKARFEKPPKFVYRPRSVDPALAKRELYRIPIERIEDPAVSELFREKQEEFDRRITMVADRDTRRFLLGSLQVFGGVDDAIEGLARELLTSFPSRTRDDSRGGVVSPEQFAERASAEMGRYRSLYPGFAGTAAVRNDVSGCLVSRGALLIGKSTRIPASRVEAMIQHEVGTHLLTYYNGRAQPFKQLETGLAGYDELQEGLAVLAEYLVGGLSRPRMRVLAARVLAVRQMIDGASFVETFRTLDRELDFEQRTAFTIAMRAYRGGGLTKDAVYLSGLNRLLEYLGRGGELRPLYIGKINTSHVPLIKELTWREILVPPPLCPPYLESESAAPKLAALDRGLSPSELLGTRRPKQ
jgi:uncharacterized protein (TIGR02421 family)